MKHPSKPDSRGAEEARQQLPAILSAAAAGRTTIITRHGRPVAAVVPAAAAKRSGPASLTALAGTGKGLWGGNSGKTVAALRDEWNR
jgi:prevent-host-death family protein